MNILGIDPGKNKFGAAVIGAEKKIIFRKIQRFQNLENRDREISDLIYSPLRETFNETLLRFNITVIALGDGTASADYNRIISRILSESKRYKNIATLLTDEKYTTEKARELYHDYNPPNLLIRWLPKTLIPVLCDVDDFAAAAIAINYVERTG